MKLSKSILLSALLLAFGAAVSAAPVPEAVPADTAPAVETAAPSDVFGASVLSQSADCAGGARGSAASLNPWQCGSCSVAACRGLGVNAPCGSGIGAQKYCRDWAGFLCTDGGSHCQCTNAIEP